MGVDQYHERRRSIKVYDTQRRFVLRTSMVLIIEAAIHFTLIISHWCAPTACDAAHQESPTGYSIFGALRIYFHVTTINSGNCSRENQFFRESDSHAPQISEEARAGWQRFLEALASRIVREEREKHQARRGER
jgi:hypothetical protein